MPVILVVDDDDALRDFIGMMLEDAGYTVRQAAGGEAALREVSLDPPDLILLDMLMPRVNGWAVVRGLKELTAAPPVIMMSGMSDTEPPELATERKHVVGYISKPFSTDQLFKICAHALLAPPPEPPQDPRDRRMNIRRNFFVDTKILSSDGTPMALGQIVNLSAGGAELDLGALMRLGTQIRLSFEVPGIEGAFDVSGRIQWCEKNRIGLAFVDLAGETENRLEQLVQE